MLPADERRELGAAGAGDVRAPVLRSDSAFKEPSICALRLPRLNSLAGDCVESLFEKAKSTSETVEGVQYAVPDDQLKADDVVRDRPYLMVTGGFPSGLHNYLSLIHI